MWRSRELDPVRVSRERDVSVIRGDGLCLVVSVSWSERVF
jgi:hypothetical protein